MSPLTHEAGRLAAATRASGGAIRLAELPFLTQLDVRLDSKGAAADSIGLALDLPLPLAPNTVVRTGESVALWLGPDEWLLVGPPGGERDLESRIREAAGEEPVSVTDAPPSAPRSSSRARAPVTCWPTAAPWISTPAPSAPAAAPRRPWAAPRSSWSPGTSPGPASGYWSAPPSPAT